MKRVFCGLLAALSCVTLGCDYGGAEASADDVSTCGEPAAAIIDTAAELEIAPGEGVGAFFEYLGDGAWRLTTTCDTSVSGDVCYWDVIVSRLGDAELGDFASEDLEGGDAVGIEYDGAVHLITTTGEDLDGIVINATPGGSLRFDAFLDGYCGDPYLFWIGEGAVHTGAPGSPLDLTPSE